MVYKAVMPELSEGEVGGFSSFHFLRTTKHYTPLKVSALYGSGGLLMCFVWKPPSNSLFVAVTDYTTLLQYIVLILRVAATADLDDDARLVERRIYTDYVIVSKETSWALLL